MCFPRRTARPWAGKLVVPGGGELRPAGTRKGPHPGCAPGPGQRLFHRGHRRRPGRHAKPLLDAIKAGQIRGAVGVVGCNNPKITQDYGHVNLTKGLIAADILVLDTGCTAVANAKAGFKVPEAAESGRAGPESCVQGLRHSAGPAYGLLRGQHPHHQPLPRPWPMPWGWTWTSCRWPRPRRSGIRRRPRPSPVTRWPAASSRFWGWRPRSWGAPAVTDLLLNGLEAHLGAKFRGGAGPGQGRGPDHPPRGGEKTGPGTGCPDSP